MKRKIDSSLLRSGDLLEILLLRAILIYVDMRLRLVPAAQNAEWLYAGRRKPAKWDKKAGVEKARRLDRLMRLAASPRFGPPPNCLRRSLALRLRLSIAGIDAIMVYGGMPGKVTPNFHCWLDVAGHMIDSFGTFAAFSGFRETHDQVGCWSKLE